MSITEILSSLGFSQEDSQFMNFGNVRSHNECLEMFDHII